MKTLIFILIILSFSVQSQVIVSDEYDNGKTLTEGKTKLDKIDLFTNYPVNQIKDAKALPLDGQGFFGIRWNKKAIGISEHYSENGSFKYYRINENESIRDAKLYRVNVLVLTESEKIFYYNFNKRRWMVATGNKFEKY